MKCAKICKFRRFSAAPRTLWYARLQNKSADLRIFAMYRPKKIECQKIDKKNSLSSHFWVQYSIYCVYYTKKLVMFFRAKKRGGALNGETKPRNWCSVGVKKKLKKKRWKTLNFCKCLSIYIYICNNNNIAHSRRFPFPAPSFWPIYDLCDGALVRAYRRYSSYVH